MNLQSPGLPDYQGHKKGFFALLHHSELFEWSDGVEERVQYVKAFKPANEVPVRLASMLYLPEDKFPALYAAREEYQRIEGPAWEEYGRIEGAALEEYKRISRAAWEEYERIKGAAWEEYERIKGAAWKEYGRIKGPAWEEYQRIKGAHREAIEAYVLATIPDCQWDGEKIKGT